MFAALGGFWLYFFNRRSVKEQFEGNRPGVEVAVPGLPIATPDAKPARPLSITIIGWFLLVGSALAPLSLLFWHSMFRSVQMPMCFLGFFLFGWSAVLVLAIWMALQLVAAVGLLKLKNWGRLVTIGLQCLGIVNGVILVAVPANGIRFQQLIDSLTASMNAQLPQPVPFVVPVWIEITILFPFFANPVVSHRAKAGFCLRGTGARDTLEMSRQPRCVIDAAFGPPAGENSLCPA